MTTNTLSTQNKTPPSKKEKDDSFSESTPKKVKKPTKSKTPAKSK